MKNLFILFIVLSTFSCQKNTIEDYSDYVVSVENVTNTSAEIIIKNGEGEKPTEDIYFNFHLSVSNKIGNSLTSYGNKYEGDGFELGVLISETEYTLDVDISDVEFNNLDFTTDTTVSEVGLGVTDIDGNHYESVIIGDQEWMTSNLKVSRFNNGDTIEYIPSEEIGSWTFNGNKDLPAYCYFHFDKDRFHQYGAIYNKNVALDTLNICPVGWHIPSSLETSKLISYVGGKHNASVIITSDSFDITLQYPLTQPAYIGSNRLRLNVVGSGYRDFNEEDGEDGPWDDYHIFSDEGLKSYLWLSDSIGLDVLFVDLEDQTVYNSWSDENDGYSIRCIKD